MPNRNMSFVNEMRFTPVNSRTNSRQNDEIWAAISWALARDTATPLIFQEGSICGALANQLLLHGA